MSVIDDFIDTEILQDAIELFQKTEFEQLRDILEEERLSMDDNEE